LLAATKTSYEGYKFCLQPKTVKEYNFYIKNLKFTKYKINKKEIYKFYFNRYLASWSLLDNFVKHKVQLKNEFFSPKILDIWINQICSKKLTKINKEIHNFIKSKKNRLISENAYKEINFQRD
jgi:hypothetical protein